MSSLVRCIESYFNIFQSKNTYHHLYPSIKKDDDSIDPADQWISEWPEFKEQVFTDSAIKKLANNILKSLNNLPIDKVNIEKVKHHLVKISHSNAYLNRLIIDGLHNKVRHKEEIRFQLIEALI